jgi:hypothetical protein
VPEQEIPGELLDQVVTTITANREHWPNTPRGRLDQRTRRIE